MKEKIYKKQYQQGDILFTQIDQLPKDAIKQQHRIVAHGESGHMHQYMDGDLYNLNGTMYAVLEQPTTLTHHEHEDQVHEKGIYKISHQRELDLLGEIRQVID